MSATRTKQSAVGWQEIIRFPTPFDQEEILHDHDQEGYQGSNPQSQSPANQSHEVLPYGGVAKENIIRNPNKLVYPGKSVGMTNNVPTEVPKSVLTDKDTDTNLPSLGNIEHNDMVYHTIPQHLHVSDQDKAVSCEMAGDNTVPHPLRSGMENTANDFDQEEILHDHDQERCQG